MMDEMDWPKICVKLSHILPSGSFFEKLADFHKRNGFLIAKQIDCVESKYYELIENFDSPEDFSSNVEDCGAEDYDHGFGFGQYEGFGW